MMGEKKRGRRERREREEREKDTGEVEEAMSRSAEA